MSPLPGRIAVRNPRDCVNNPGAVAIVGKDDHMANSTCSIEGCEKTRWARGWCGTHYRRWERHGSTDDPKPFTPSPCTVDGCDLPIASRGYCNAHYLRVRQYGDIRADIPRKHHNRPVVDGRKQCTGCDEWKTLDDFAESHTCRECKRARQLAWVASNPDYWREWQAANPDKVSASVQKRRAARLSREHEFIDRTVVFERDGFICQLCDEPMAMDEKCPHPLAPTVDHVVPLNRGGHHLYSNVQSAHFHCNTSKGDRDEPLSRPSVA